MTADKEMSVLRYWFRSPFQSLVTILGFGAILWLATEFLLRTDQDMVVRCFERLIAADPTSLLANDARRAISEIGEAAQFELVTESSREFPGMGSLTEYEYLIDGNPRATMCF